MIKNPIILFPALLLAFILCISARIYQNAYFMHNLTDQKTLFLEYHSKDSRTQIRSLRVLQQQPTTNSSSSYSNNDNKKSFLPDIDYQRIVTIITIVVIVAFGALVLCIVCIIRFIIKEQARERAVRPLNSPKRCELYLPKIQYREPFQTECTICLQQFKALNLIQKKDEKDGKNQRNTNKQIKDVRVVDIQENITDLPSNAVFKSQRQVSQAANAGDDNKQLRNIQPQQNDSPNLMMLTYCGHLMHAQCLSKWMQKQYSCPTCRQSFNQKNILKMQKQLDVELIVNKSNADEKIDGLQKQQNTPVRRISLHIQNYYEGLILTQQHKKMVGVYCKIMKYHKKNKSMEYNEQEEKKMSLQQKQGEKDKWANLSTAANQIDCSSNPITLKTEKNEHKVKHLSLSIQNIQ